MWEVSERFTYRRHHKKNNTSNFKISYTEDEIRSSVERPRSTRRLNIPKQKKQTVYAIGVHQNSIIKDRTKHCKPQNTSGKIKKLRDQSSAISGIPGSPKVKKTDDGSILRINAKSKEIEFKHEPPRTPLGVSDINARQNIGEPIKIAGLSRNKPISARGSRSNKFYDSQIVLGNDENYMPMSTTKLSYSNLVSPFYLTH